MNEFQESAQQTRGAHLTTPEVSRPDPQSSNSLCLRREFMSRTWMTHPIKNGKIFWPELTGSKNLSRGSKSCCGFLWKQ